MKYICRDIIKISFMKKKFFLYFFFSLCAYIAILRSSYLFADDAYRTFTYTKLDQGGHGRPFADIIYYFFSAGTFMDMSPITQLSSIALLLGTAFLTIEIFKPNTDNQSSLFYMLPLIFTTFPLHYTLISYRFDSITMSLAIFLPVAAFYIVNRYTEKTSIIIPSCLLTASAATYQPMYSLYIILFFVYLAYLITSNRFRFSVFKKHIQCIIYSILCYIPIYIYTIHFADKSFFFLKEHPHTARHSKIIPVQHLLESIYSNINSYIKTCYSYVGFDIISITSISSILCSFLIIILAKISTTKKLLASLCIALAFISCSSIQMILQNPIFAARTLNPVSFYIFIIFVFVYYQHNKKINNCLFVMAVLFYITAAGILTAIGNAQRDQEQLEHTVLLQPLAADLNEIMATAKSISIYFEENIPIHPSYVKLKEKFRYVEISTIARHVQLASYYNIKYKLSSNPHENQVVKSRLAYTIYKTNDQIYIVKIHNNYVPHRNTLINN